MTPGIISLALQSVGSGRCNECLPAEQRCRPSFLRSHFFAWRSYDMRHAFSTRVIAVGQVHAERQEAIGATSVSIWRAGGRTLNVKINRVRLREAYPRGLLTLIQFVYKKWPVLVPKSERPSDWLRSTGARSVPLARAPFHLSRFCYVNQRRDSLRLSSVVLEDTHRDVGGVPRGK